ncbi:hypothetical protein BC938DRAFT_473872 [Jimgerdemannia flammicorona]|uniref:Uncharacterized protein n=1 Tax=Jimgerdemannia flammicorona TaxID=994334 RepID=A0A433Q392_9FUNG|nr:hypothetical protein BC938DRAFT_473872 [Jimgerdemannia flammicorona]
MPHTIHSIHSQPTHLEHNMDQPTQQKQNTDQGIKYTLALPTALADTNAPDSTSQAFVPQGKWVRKADRTKETVDKAEADGQPDEMGFVARVERGVGAAGKKRPQRPNFFLSTRLDADGLQASLQEFAKHVKGKHPEYSKLLIPPEQIIKTFYSNGPPSLRFMGIGRSC